MHKEITKSEKRKSKLVRAIFAFRVSIFVLLFLIAARWSPATATTVSGTLKAPDGAPVTGTIEFTLSQQAKTTTPPVTFAPSKTTCTVTAGLIAAGCSVQGNDTLTPAGTFYRVRVLDSNNVVVVPSTNYTFSGAAVDLGSLPVTATETLVPPTGSVTGNLNVTGNLTVGGSATFGADPEDFFHLRLLGQTADPSTAALGSVFHRSDLNRIRFRVGGLEVFDGTQYIALTTPAAQTFSFGGDIQVPNTFSALFKRLNATKLVDPNLWTESGVTAKIDAAITDCGGSACLVILPSNLGAGSPTSVPATVSILDLRTGGNTTLSPLNGVRVVDGVKFATIQAAINDLPSTGGEVFIPCGSYSSASAITIAKNDVIVRGSGACTIVQFTGATHGFVIDASSAARLRIKLSDMVIRTSNAGGLHAIEGNAPTWGISRTVVDNVWIDATGSGKWTAAIYGDNWQSSDFYAVHLEANTTGLPGFSIGLQLQNFSNALTFHGLKIQGPNCASGSVNRAIQLTNITDLFIFGGTFQGCFGQSALFSTASSPHIYGVHIENTQAAPSDGQDVVLNGASVNTSFSGIQGGSFNIGSGAGSVRNCSISASEVAAVTLGVNTSQCTVVSTRAASITDNQTAGGNTLVGNGTSGGATFANKLTLDLLTANTTSVPGVAPVAGAAQVFTNGGTVYARDSGGTALTVWIPMSASNQSFLQYKAGGLLAIRNTTPTTKVQFDDTNTTFSTHALFGTDNTYNIGASTSSRPNSVNAATAVNAPTHQAASGQGNSVTVSANANTGGAGGNVTVQAGNSSFAGGAGGNITLTPGDPGAGGTPGKIILQKSVSGDASGFKHIRVSTGSISAASSAAVTVTWTTAFADSNYTASCSLVEATASTSTLRIHHLESVTAASLVIRVVNDDGASAHTGTLHCTAAHD